MKYYLFSTHIGIIPKNRKINKERSRCKMEERGQALYYGILSQSATDKNLITLNISHILIKNIYSEIGSFEKRKKTL
jgi:hypothetical protein